MLPADPGQVQKPKTHKEIKSIRLQKYKYNRVILGMSQEDAAVAAGYSPSTARGKNHLIERAAKVGIATLMERKGLTDNKIVDHLAEGLKATRLFGKDAVEGDDWMARHKYFESAIDLKQLRPDPRLKNPEAQALHVRVLNIITNNYNNNIPSLVPTEGKKTVDADVSVNTEETDNFGVTIA